VTAHVAEVNDEMLESSTCTTCWTRRRSTTANATRDPKLNALGEQFLEEQFPELRTPDSATVGRRDTVDADHAVEHLERLMSLDNVFSAESTVQTTCVIHAGDFGKRHRP
jgi:NAD-dependent DNA ligase